MPVLRFVIHVAVRKDNETEFSELSGFPLRIEQNVDEVTVHAPYEEPTDPDDVTFSQVPLDQIGDVQAFLVGSVDQPIGVRDHDAPGGGGPPAGRNSAVRLNMRGVLLGIGLTMPAVDFMINNDSGQAAKVIVVAGGT